MDGGLSCDITGSSHTPVRERERETQREREREREREQAHSKIK